MLNAIKDFFIEGVFPTSREILSAKPTKALLGGFGTFVVPGMESVTLFRVLAHESAHGIEGLMSGAELKGIEVEYRPLQITGKTELDNTTPESAVSISLAGIGCDVGFIACSTLVLKKISPTGAMMFLAYDLISFFISNDYRVYRSAKGIIQRKKL